MKHEQTLPDQLPLTENTDFSELTLTKSAEFTDETIELSYDAYDYLRDSQNFNSPQLQGLGPEEFSDAMLDSDCVKLVLELEDGPIVIPVLIPVEKAGWFSLDFFNNRYRKDSTTKSDIYLYNHVPGIYEHDRGRYVKTMQNALAHLAEDGAVLIVDYPLFQDMDLEAQVDEVFDLSAIIVEEDFLYREGEPGFETHYAGKTEALRLNPEKPTTSLNEAYAMAVREGRYDPDIATGTVMLDEIDDKTLDNIWRIYKEPFDDLSAEHPIRQGLTKEELRDILTDKDTAKFAYKEDEEIVSLCMLTRNIGACEWLDEKFYERKFKEDYQDGKVYYFPGIVTDMERRGERHIQNTIQLLAEMIEYSGYDPVITFECCDTNSEFLPGLIESVVENTGVGSVRFGEIAKQAYRVFKLRK